MDVISEYIASNYGIDRNKNYCIRWVDPIELVSKDRLDIIAKWIYIDCYEKKASYGKDIYLQHLKAITKNSMVEGGNESKNGINEFIRQFNTLIIDIKGNGYRDEYLPVPVDNRHRILDGSHRVACCLYYNKKVKIIELPVNLRTSYDYSFLTKNNLSEEYIDDIVNKYAHLKNDVYLANIWPVAIGKDKELEEIMSAHGSIIYKKSITLTQSGGINYIRQIYKKEKWVGSIYDGFEGCYRKYKPCFGKNNVLRIVLFEIDDGYNVVDLKEEIRRLFGMGKHSIHINDSHEEVIDMVNLLLNSNAINYLNCWGMVSCKKSYINLLSFKQQKYKENMAITGSVVLALHGIRESRDIDYISLDDSDMTSHNKISKYYPDTIPNLLSNPKYYFYSDGMTILTLHVVYEMKKNRNEGKDREDVKEIGTYLSNHKISPYVAFKYKVVHLKRNIIATSQGLIIKIAHKTNTYDQLKRMYHKCKSRS